MNRMPRRLLTAGTALCVLAFVASVVLVLFRMEPQVTAAPVASPSGTRPGAPSAVPGPTVRRVFPVIPLPGHPVSYGRTHHGYPASDMLTECGGTYVAPVSGVVNHVSRVDTWERRANLGETRGGLSVAILGDDGVRYYGSHFQSVYENVVVGLRVRAGDPIAIVGRSGDAGACHVHFGLSPVCFKHDWFVRRGLIWPWPYLDSWRGGGNADPGPEIQQWLADNGGCPTKPTVES